jgi:hypothetical protein
VEVSLIIASCGSAQAALGWRSLAWRRAENDDGEISILLSVRALSLRLGEWERDANEFSNCRDIGHYIIVQPVPRLRIKTPAMLLRPIAEHLLFCLSTANVESRVKRINASKTPLDACLKQR